MGFLFSFNKKERNVLIFDIGSASIGSAIVTIPISSKKLPVIKKSIRTEIKRVQDTNLDHLLKETVYSLNSNIKLIKKENKKKIDEIFCVLSSPWYISETKLVKYKKDNCFIFTKKLSNILLKEESQKFKNFNINKHSSLNSPSEVIEHHVIDVSLNGYKIEDPIGKKTKSVEMSMIMSLSPSFFLDKLRNVFSDNFKFTKVEFSTFIVSSYIAVRDRYVGKKSYLLLDISGEITDVGIVLNGVLKQSLSFPFGKRTFFRYMCTKLNIELRDAEELFSLYSSDKLSTEFRAKIAPLFKSIENSWGEAFREKINSLPRTLILPNTIFLTADGDIKEWFAQVLRTEENLQAMVENQKCEVVTLSGPEFLDMCKVEEGTCDPFLMIEAVSVSRKKENKYE